MATSVPSLSLAVGGETTQAQRGKNYTWKNPANAAAKIALLIDKSESMEGLYFGGGWWGDESMTTDSKRQYANNIIQYFKRGKEIFLASI